MVGPRLRESLQVPSGRRSEFTQPRTQHFKAQFCRKACTLQHKADPTLRDNRGLCSVHYAAAAGNTEALIHLLDNCKYGELAELRQQGRGQLTCGTTPVHLAAANGHKEALLTLLSRHKHSNSLGNFRVTQHK